jgi:tetratricopeptide (TPR) repeat protein
MARLQLLSWLVIAISQAVAKKISGGALHCAGAPSSTLIKTMAFISVKDAALTISQLLLEQRIEQAVEIALRASNSVRKAQHWTELCSMLESQFTDKQRLNHVLLAPLYARALVGDYEMQRLETFLEKALAIHTLEARAKLIVEQSFLFYVKTQFAKAQEQLETALPFLAGIDLGIALARLGMCRSMLGLDDWQEPFLEMRTHLIGRTLGIQLLNEASCYTRLGQTEKAITILYEALPHLKVDTFHFANLHTSLGLALLRSCHPDAIIHFEMAERMTRGANYRKLHAHIIKCMAAYYQMRGEWSRAILLYQRCIKTASKPISQDFAARDESLLNLGRTLRLQSKPTEALDILQDNLEAYPHGFSGVLIERAAAFLQLGMLSNAQNCLAEAHMPKAEDADLKHILSAELHRLNGNTQAMLEELKAVPMTERLVREEAGIWIALFATVKELGAVVPEPLFQIVRHEIHLGNLGIPQVKHNGSEIKLPPKAHELLAFLSWNNGSSEIQDCIQHLYNVGLTEIGKYKDRFERVLEKLRASFSIPNLVLRQQKTLSLSTEVIWQDDAKNYLAGMNIPWRGMYLAGIHNNWIDEIAITLENTRLDRQAEQLLSEDELRILELAERIRNKRRT